MKEGFISTFNFDLNSSFNIIKNRKYFQNMNISKELSVNDGKSFF